MLSNGGIRRPRIIFHEFDRYAVGVCDTDPSFSRSTQYGSQRCRSQCCQPGEGGIEAHNENALDVVANIAGSPSGWLWTRFRRGVLKELVLKEALLIETIGPNFKIDRTWNTLDFR